MGIRSIASYIFAGWVALMLYGFLNSSLTYLAIGSMMYFLCALPTFIYFKNKEDNIPFFPLLGLVYFIYFGYPAFVPQNIIIMEGVGESFLMEAFYLSMCGIFLMICGFYLPISKQIAELFPKVRLEAPRRMLLLASILWLAGTFSEQVLYLFKIPLEFHAIVIFLTYLSLLGLALFFKLYLDGKLSKPWRIAFMAVFLPLKLLRDIGTGNVFQVIQTFAILFLVFMRTKRKIRLKVVIPIVLFIVLLLGYKAEFRNITWFGTTADVKQNIFSKGMVFLQLVKDKVLSEKGVVRDSVVEASGRMNYLYIFARIIQIVPESEPYWQGETYKGALLGFVPRFIYPEKLDKSFGNVFGRKYGFLSIIDFGTAYNLAQMVEFYVNFGLTGLLIGMFFMGILYRILQAVLNHPRIGEGGWFIALIILWQSLNIESNFLIVFGGTVQYIILLYFIFKMFTFIFP